MNMKKGMIAFTIMLCCVMANSISLEAASLPQSGTTGKCGDNVTWTYLDNQWVYQPGLYIEGTGAVYDYQAGKAPWSKYAKGLKEIVVCNGVTSIGKNAFYGMTGLQRIVITDDVVQIDDTAFDGCNKQQLVFCVDSSYGKAYAKKHGYQVLEGYAAPSSEKTITKGSNVSMGCLNYTVTKQKDDSNEVSVIGMNTRKKKVTIPASIVVNDVSYKVTAIADNAFKNNETINEVVIGKNVSSIGKRAFYRCKKLKAITIKTKKLSSNRVGTKAFGKTGTSVVVKVSKASIKPYKKFLYKKGLDKKAKIRQ